MTERSQITSKADFSEKEQKLLLQYVMQLNKSIIQSFLREKDLTRSGTKPEIRGRIEKHIGKNKLSYIDLIKFLDKQAPQQKQHVFLYDGPEVKIDKWRDREKGIDIIKQNDLREPLKSSMPIALPEELTISTIDYNEDYLKIVAARRREGQERRPEYDDEFETDEGKTVIRKAYFRVFDRNIAIFTWNLLGNIAKLQIKRLPGGSKYEKVEEEFFNLVDNWLPRNYFKKVKVERAIKRLHELEATENRETRSHDISYKTPLGRKVSAKSTTISDSVIGEESVRKALDEVRNTSSGQLGNFYWLPNTGPTARDNPLSQEMHVIIVGKKKRINITRPQKIKEINYVLSRIRSLSQ